MSGKHPLNNFPFDMLNLLENQLADSDKARLAMINRALYQYGLTQTFPKKIHALKKQEENYNNY